MISSNTRASRLRNSSPQQAAANGSTTTPPVKNAPTDDSKTFMQRWLEPPVQVRPSFQEAGLMRHGVVENMAPLGTMPKAGIFKKSAATADPTPPTRRIVLKKSAAASNPPTTAPTRNSAEDDTEEEEQDGAGNDNISGEAEDDEEPENGARPPVASTPDPASRDTDDDEDYAPTKTASSGHKGQARRSVVPRASTGRRSSASSSLQQTSQTSAARTSDIKEAVDKVIELAVDEALKHFRYPTAWALRTLYDENSSNPEFLTMMEEIYSQTADPDTLEQFYRMLHDKKREGKRDNKGCYYFIPPSTNSRFAPHKPKRAPYSDLVRLEMPSLQQVEPAQINAEEESQIETPAKKRRRSAKATESPSKMVANGANGKAKEESPRRRKTRANSASSSSSLSSARSMTPPDGIDESDVFDVPPSRASPAAEASNNAPTAAQPIVGRKRSKQAKKSEIPSPTPAPSISSTRTTTVTTRQSQSRQSSGNPNAASNTAAAAEPPLFPNLSSKKGSQKTNGLPVFPSKVGTIDKDDAKLRLRQRARDVTNSGGQIPESFSREPTEQSYDQMPANDASHLPATRPRTSLPVMSSTPAVPNVNTRSTRSARKRSHDEMEEQSSPTTAHFLPSEVGSTAANSRAGTPSLRPAKKTRTGLRVKSSPMKKRTGTSAGIPRASGERSSPMGNGNGSKEDDNDDYCSSCGGNGDLVCCDGCTRSFHLSCVDPPLIADRMPAEWFCNVCLSNREPASFPARSGLFGVLMENLDAKNSSAFRLPASDREYFEGVQTGVDGEYEEASAPVKTAKKRKSEEDQVPDFFRQRNNEGGAALCHVCQKATSHNRAIVPCSVCALWWHLDCLDPPMANPPVLRTWRCPCHVHDLLAKVSGPEGRPRKYRKIKHAPAITPSFPRGNINNGFIEVTADESEDESGWKDVGTFGRVYRLPETGIKLDFLTRARENRKGKPIEPIVPVTPPTTSRLPMMNRSVEEQQAALNLVQLSGQEPSDVENLVDALLALADPAIISLIARGNPEHIANNELAQFDRQSLHAILAQMESMASRIRGVLLTPSEDQSSQAQGAPTVVTAATTPAKVGHEHVSDSETAEAEADNKKNLPSPAATECVTTSTQPEEKPNGTDIKPLAASDESQVRSDMELPQTPTNETKISEEDVAMEPPSDDLTTVED